MGELSAVRHGNFKVMFSQQEAHGFDVWKNPYTPLAWPNLFDLRADPFETGPRETIGWGDWSARRMYTLSAAGLIAQDFLRTFLDYPPRQSPGSFSVDGIMQQLEAAQARMGG